MIIYCLSRTGLADQAQGNPEDPGSASYDWEEAGIVRAADGSVLEQDARAIDNVTWGS